MSTGSFAMSSNLFMYDGSIYSDPFSPLNDSLLSIDNILQENYSSNKTYQGSEINQMAATLLSSSPPSHQMGSLSLCQTPLENNAYTNFSALQIKTEDSQLPFYSCAYDNITYSSSFPSYGTEPVKMMQRSFSSNCFDGKTSFLFQPQIESLVESTNFSATTSQALELSSPENSSSSISQMRRFCSAGDLQSIKTSQVRPRSSCSPLATESSCIQEANSKVGRYSAEERKEKIHRYRAKRTQRNFNKTIKYACRKTLADNRPRIRGRFARNDETVNYNPREDEDNLWNQGFFDEEENDKSPLGRGVLLNSYGNIIQYYMPADCN